MFTLTDAVRNNEYLTGILNDLSINNTDAATAVDMYFMQEGKPDFTTTRHSVRRWRQHALDGPESPAETLTISELGQVLGSFIKPLEVVTDASMKILILDIEMSPNLVYTWTLKDTTIWPQYILYPTEMLCFSAKWIGEETQFYSVHHDGEIAMTGQIRELLDQADVVMHYFGRAFDIPHINRKILKMGMLPPSPFKQLDLCSVIKSKYNFPYNKLEYVTKELGLPTKGSVGSDTWLGVMADDRKSWEKFRDYSINDTEILEALYFKVQPWIQNHPSFASFTGKNVCPNCGSDKLERNGFSYTPTSRFPRFVCKDCGKWSRNSKRISGTEVREITQ